MRAGAARPGGERRWARANPFPTPPRSSGDDATHGQRNGYSRSRRAPARPFCFRRLRVADFLELELRRAPRDEHAAKWLEQNPNPVEPVLRVARSRSLAANRGRTGYRAPTALGGAQSGRDTSPPLPADSPLTTGNRR